MNAPLRPQTVADSAGMEGALRHPRSGDENVKNPNSEFLRTQVSDAAVQALSSVLETLLMIGLERLQRCRDNVSLILCP